MNTKKATHTRSLSMPEVNSINSLPAYNQGQYNERTNVRYTVLVKTKTTRLKVCLSMSTSNRMLVNL